MSRKQHPVRKAFRAAVEDIRHVVIGAGIFTVDRDVPEGELPRVVLHTEALHQLLGRFTEAQNRSIEHSWANLHADLRRVLQAKPTERERKGAARHRLHLDLMKAFDRHLERFMDDETARSWLGLDGSMELRDWFYAKSMERPRRFMRAQLKIEKVKQFTYTVFTDDIGIWLNCAAQERELDKLDRSIDVNVFDSVKDGLPHQAVPAQERSSREDKPNEWDRTLAGLLNKFGPEPGELLDDYLERVIWLYHAYAERWEEVTVAEYNNNHDALPRNSTVRVQVSK